MKLAFSATQVVHSAGKNVEMHSHCFGQFVVILHGTMTIRTLEGWWLVPPGLSLWIPSGIEHWSSYSEDTKIILIDIEDDENNALPNGCHPVIVSDLLRELVLAAVIHFEMLLSGSDHREDELLVLIFKMIILQIRNSKDKPSLFVPQGIDKRLRIVTERMQKNPGEDLSLSFLAQQANTSERTLARLFVSETGMTFRRWRQHLRLVKAVDLLARDEAISQVAFDLGYSSASNFTTFFTRVLGMSPGKYVQKIHPKIKP